jgi:NAD(P)-dependent dehydrogenase (short-subunit alcohol dehydrogenase family)
MKTIRSLGVLVSSFISLSGDGAAAGGRCDWTNAMRNIARRFSILLALWVVSSGAIAADEAQRTVLVTGANRGIGYEFVKQFSAKGYRVIATCRNPDRAEELKSFADDHDNVVIERLDLVDLKGIDTLAAKYAGQPIDVLINNAALMRGPDEGQTFGSMDYEEFDTFFNINVKGPLKVTEAFWPHVAASEEKMIASLTTSQGRQGIPIDGFAYYKSSKAAIDNLYIDIGRRGRKDGIKVLTLIPGRVPTHGETNTKGMTPVEVSIAGMIEVMDNHELKQNGKSFWFNGNESK